MYITSRLPMTQSVPLFSAQAVNAGIDLMAPVARVIDSHWYILGRETAGFESEFAEYLQIGHCIGVANGTDALELALRALDVMQGDEVVICANAGFYANTALRLIGARAQYVDIDPATLTMSVDGLRVALESCRPKAVVVTHLYGQMADIEALTQIANAAGVPVIEDCAQSHGARRNGQQAGTVGTIGTFSFYPTKNLGALGDGGAIVCGDEALAQRVRQLRQYGWATKYHVAADGGCNSRLDEIQAAILRAKLPHLDAWNSQRRSIAQRYNQAFANLPVCCPVSTGDDYVAHLYVLRMKNRDAFRQFLGAHGIATDIHYPVPDHRQAVVENEHGQWELPHTESACTEVVTLPCFPGLPDADVARVIEAVTRYFSQD
ncbi:DegT/DnrJ/EryC1/StrS family aminotransferase [Cupriavidus agavae]|nr:DegT/DnrJ/EryC1/StrS family aminotransferase [Cupriavidus agavae]